MFHKKGESAAAQDLFEDDFLEGRKIPENREKDIVSCLLLTWSEIIWVIWRSSNWLFLQEMEVLLNRSYISVLLLMCII